MPERIAPIRFEALPHPDQSPGDGVVVTGLWRLSADDPRMAGLSGLGVLDPRHLIAVTDFGVLIDLPKPGAAGPARFRDLLGGPGYATYKKHRDAEALLIGHDRRAPGGIAFEVTFEFRHALFAFGRNGQPLGGERLPPVAGWSKNKGAEALVIDPLGPRRLMLGEKGRNLIIQDRRGMRVVPLRGATGGVADAVRLPDGRLVAAVREVGIAGLTNRLAWLERDGSGYRLRNFATLPFGAFDNVEGLAAEKGPDGRITLWAVTDSDGWRRTLLMRMTLDTRKAPA